ncbi:hypothetical protein Tco_0663195 [Tanacetum coccineum]
MLLVPTNPNAGQADDVVAPSQPSSYTPPVPSTSFPPAVTTPPPIPTPTPPPITTPTPTPPPIPSPTQISASKPPPFEHTYEESSPPGDRSKSKPSLTIAGNAIVKLSRKVKKKEGFDEKEGYLGFDDTEEEEPEVQGRKSQDDPLASSVQGLVTPPTTKDKEKKSSQDQLNETPKKKQKKQISQEKLAILEAISWSDGFKEDMEVSSSEKLRIEEVKEEFDNLRNRYRNEGPEYNVRKGILEMFKIMLEEPLSTDSILE